MASKSEFEVIGKPRRRVDGRAKVTGQTRFADAVPEFVPYARMSQKDIEECEVDL